MRTNCSTIWLYTFEYRVCSDVKFQKKENSFDVCCRDLLREAVQSKSERGEQLNALMKEGKLVPMVNQLRKKAHNSLNLFSFRKLFSIYSRKIWLKMPINPKVFSSMDILVKYHRLKNSKNWFVEMKKNSFHCHLNLHEIFRLLHAI